MMHSVDARREFARAMRLLCDAFMDRNGWGSIRCLEVPDWFYDQLAADAKAILGAKTDDQLVLTTGPGDGRYTVPLKRGQILSMRLKRRPKHPKVLRDDADGSVSDS